MASCVCRLSPIVCVIADLLLLADRTPVERAARHIPALDRRAADKARFPLASINIVHLAALGRTARMRPVLRTRGNNSPVNHSVSHQLHGVLPDGPKHF